MTSDLKCTVGARHVWVIGRCLNCGVSKHRYTAAKREADNRKLRALRRERRR